jgi:hypothetical protein
MEIKVEVWKDINDFPNYQVSNFGRIKSKERFTKVGIRNVRYVLRKEKILKPLKITNGYLGIRLYNGENVKTFKIHRLVANHFIPNPKNYPQVNHIDGDKTNNMISNLEWCTNEYNMKHSYNIGLRDKEKLRKNMSIIGKSLKGKNGHHIRKVVQIDKHNNKIIKKWNSIIEASKEMNISNTAIQNVCVNRSKTAGGYIWEYV